MGIILGIVVGVLFAIQDWAWIIKANWQHFFKRKYAFYNNIQHYSKFLVVLIIPLMLYFFKFEWNNVLAFYFTYYVVFESTLNLIRKKKLFYVSAKGSKSDEFRTRVFGKNAEIVEMGFKVIALVAAYFLEFRT